MNTTWLLMAMVALAAIVLLMQSMKGRASMSTVKEKIKAGAKIVDVRSPEEFRDGAYPGAVNIPVGDLGRRMNEIPKGVPVVLYCASGARSGLAARAMRQAGYTDVVNAGGLRDMPR